MEYLFIEELEVVVNQCFTVCQKLLFVQNVLTCKSNSNLNDLL